MPNPTDFHATMVRRRQRIIAELQTFGLYLTGETPQVSGRRGGAGPSDHTAVTVLGTTVMVPVHTHQATTSPYSTRGPDPNGEAVLLRGSDEIGVVTFPSPPRFYDLQTADGIPYWKIAQLHARDVLATTILQHCFRYPDATQRCQFCAIGESLRGGRTIARKSPAQLAEVAEAAVRLDSVQHMVLTTGTPQSPDRGASLLADCARAITDRVSLPIQAQCEPPEDFGWFLRLRDAGVVTLGMHLEAFDPAVRARIMPSKAELPVSLYLEAYRAAVDVFGRGQVSTYLLAGLGDSPETTLDGCRTLIGLGVYPFVVPFVPITGTPFQHHPAPTPAFLQSILEPLGRMLREAGMTSTEIRAGCGKCAACSPLSTFEA